MNTYGKLLLGLLTVAGLTVLFVMSSGTTSAATTTVAVGDIFYCDKSFSGSVCTTTITAGDTVIWDFSGAEIAHTVTECGSSCSDPTSSPRFDSGVVQGGGDSYQYTFAAAGTYNYYCQIHAFDQQGKIVVQASVTTPTIVPGTATPLATLQSGNGSGLPPTGYGTPTASSSHWWALVALAIVGITLLWSCALAFVRTRR